MLHDNWKKQWIRLAENAGYGFDKMINGWKAYTGTAPEFDQGQDYTKVTFFIKSQAGTKLAPSRHQAGTKLALSWDQAGTKLGLSITEIRQLLEFCREVQTIQGIMSLMNWSDRTKFRNKYINPMLEHGFLAMTEPDKPKSPNQKYHTTEKGIQLLAE